MNNHGSTENRKSVSVAALSQYVRLIAPQHERQRIRLRNGRDQAGRRFSVSSESYDELAARVAAESEHTSTSSAGPCVCASTSPALSFQELEPEQEERLQKVFERCALLRHHKDCFREIVSVMVLRETRAGEVVVLEGELPGRDFYVVERGRFAVSVRDPAGNGTTVVDVLGPGRSFGELALLYDIEHAATVTSETEGALWVLNRHAFKRVVIAAALRRRRRDAAFLATVPLLRHLHEAQLERLADAVEHQAVCAGTTIIEQGDATPGAADNLYLVEQGRVTVTTHDESGAAVVCHELGPTDYFGELSFMANAPRFAEVRAVC